MKLCIPIDQNANQGLESEVFAHFGSAPAYLIVDTHSGGFRSVPNRHRKHGPGGCVPLESIRDEDVDAIVVRHIGRGALSK